MASRMMGVALLAALPLMSMVAAEPPQCQQLYSKQWKGGRTNATQGGQEYTWVFNPCTPGPADRNCNQPPYSGNVYLANLNLNNPNPCVHQLFCEASPSSITKANGVVTYEFPQCVPSQTGHGPSPRSATVTVTCDSPTYRMDPVIATKTNPGYHFEVHVHAPCSSSPYAPPPSTAPIYAPVAPLAPLPAPCLGVFAETATDFFTLPLNSSGSQHGQVYDWGFNLCHRVEYNGNTGYFLNMNAKTRHITNLNVLDMATQTANGYKFSFSSSYNENTAVVEVLTDGGECAWLSAPEYGVVGTINDKGGIQYNVIAKCMSS